ncbi:MAG TPA: DUF6188 family protein [Thermoleophilaceae bacterium]|nr:DUF6188 family protein [Thermoleophilaceae bacterium]
MSVAFTLDVRSHAIPAMAGLASGAVRGEVRELPYRGWAVTRISLDWQFRLLLAPDDPRSEAAEIIVEAEFEYVASDGSAHRLSPGPPQENLAPALGMHAQTVASCTASADGHLAVSFEDGSQLHVSPTLKYDAWEICGPVGMLCGAGGGKPWPD